MRTRSCVFRFVGGFGGAVLLSLLTPVTGLGGYWLAGDAPSATILHQTLLTPPEPSRTTIGIGETVNLSVNYSDADIWVDDTGWTFAVPDMYGEVEWSCNGPGSLEYIRGPTNAYYAPRSVYDTCDFVEVAVHDSGSQYVDPVAYDGVGFDILVPNWPTAELLQDNPIGTPAPPVNSMGAWSIFAFQTFPATVNFTAVAFQELVPAQTFTWPDGTPEPYPDVTMPFGVQDRNGIPNWCTDDVSTGGPWMVERLQIPGSDPPAYQGCEFNVIQHLQYFSDSGWVTYAIVGHPRRFSGTTFRSQVGWGGAWGGWQGPYQEDGF